MTVLYLDSSAFVKLYVSEAQSGQVEQLLDQHPEVASCVIAQAEVYGAFAVQCHQGRLSEEDYQAARKGFEDDWENVNSITVGPVISRTAADLLKSQPGLRAMDALHLASALAIRQETEVKFLSFDQKLQDAAQRFMPEAMV